MTGDVRGRTDTAQYNSDTIGDSTVTIMTKAPKRRRATLSPISSHSSHASMPETMRMATAAPTTTLRLSPLYVILFVSVSLFLFRQLRFVPSSLLVMPSAADWSSFLMERMALTASGTSSPRSFAGCLLVMDDNFRLAEWIAYHYHVLPLRYLVVAVDPRSKFSPEPILTQFRHLLNMTIITWTDEDYGDWEPIPLNSTSWGDLRERYLLRQKVFLWKCMEYLHQQNQSWTMLWDTDEFIVYTFYNQTTSLTDKVIQTPQDLTNPGTVIQYLEPNDPERACVSLNRALVGAKEIDFSILQNEVNDLVHVKQLDTLRFRYHNDWDARLNGRNKVMLNVQYVNHTAFVKTPHRPARNLECFFTPTKKSSFYLKHYISSWEAFSFRDDSRRYRERSYAAWHSRAFQTSKHYDDSIVSWLDGFVQNVGKEKALALLQNSGLPLDYNASHKVQDYYCSYGCRSSPSPLPTPQPVR